MSELPMHYTTCFHWLGTDSDGQIAIKRRPDMPTGSPHTDGRYCPEHMLVAAADTTVWLRRGPELWLVRLRDPAPGEARVDALELTPRTMGVLAKFLRVDVEMTVVPVLQRAWFPMQREQPGISVRATDLPKML